MRAAAASAMTALLLLFSVLLKLLLLLSQRLPAQACLSDCADHLKYVFHSVVYRTIPDLHGQCSISHICLFRMPSTQRLPLCSAQASFGFLKLEANELACISIQCVCCHWASHSPAHRHDRCVCKKFFLAARRRSIPCWATDGMKHAKAFSCSMQGSSSF